MVAFMSDNAFVVACINKQGHSSYSLLPVIIADLYLDGVLLCESGHQLLSRKEECHGRPAENQGETIGTEWSLCSQVCEGIFRV